MCQLVTLSHPGLTYIFNFWHSDTLALSSEHQSVRMSEITKMYVRPGCHWTLLTVSTWHHRLRIRDYGFKNRYNSRILRNFKNLLKFVFFVSLEIITGRCQDAQNIGLSKRILKSALKCTYDHNARPSQTDGQTDRQRQTDGRNHGNSATIRFTKASRA